MTQDEIIEMARHIADTFGTRMCDENGNTHGEELYCMGIDDIVETIKLVAAKEREACVEIAERQRYAMFISLTSHPTQNGTAVAIANAIKARGEQA